VLCGTATHLILAELHCPQDRNGSSSSAAQVKPATPPGTVVRRPEVMDDFIRNFYVKMGLTRTAEVFEAEWYELKATGRLEGAATTVPDIYLRNGVSSCCNC
jgi:hypothetical protein